VTLSHPGKFNAMSRAMWRELREVFRELPARARTALRVVRGQGGHFCAGGDIAEYPAFRFRSASLRAFTRRRVGRPGRHAGCDLPIVAQIDGHCMGAGVEIASCCDIRVAGTRRALRRPDRPPGFSDGAARGAAGGAALGEATARELLLEAAVLDAAEMQARGFLNRVLDDRRGCTRTRWRAPGASPRWPRRPRA
jgi:enoyl-CoA hydratase/carnithine racemase